MSPKTHTASATADRELSLTRLLDAPRHLVWSAWSDPARIVKWFGPRGFRMTMHSRDFRTGGAWRFTLHGPDGRDYFNNVVLLEVKEPERIVYKHVPEPGGEPVRHETTVTLIEKGAKTELTLRMIFPSTDELAAAIRDYGADKGLVECFDRLTELLASPPSGAASAGIIRPIEIVREFDAPRELVFRAWTERERMMQWWGPKGFDVSFASLDLRPGGVFHYCLKSPAGMEMWGRLVFSEIHPPERLVFILSFSDREGRIARHPVVPDWPREIRNTIRFEARGGRTRVTVEWLPINTTQAERDAFETGRAGVHAGMAGTFAQLDAYLLEQSR